MRVPAKAVLNTEEALLKLHNHNNLLIYTASLYKNRRVLIRLTILNKYLIEKVFGLVHSSSFGLMFISLGPRCSWSNIAITSSAWIRSCKRGREEMVTAELQFLLQLIQRGSGCWEDTQQGFYPRTSSVGERMGRAWDSSWGFPAQNKSNPFPPQYLVPSSLQGCSGWGRADVLQFPYHTPLAATAAAHPPPVPST